MFAGSGAIRQLSPCSAMRARTRASRSSYSSRAKMTATYRPARARCGGKPPWRVHQSGHTIGPVEASAVTVRACLGVPPLAEATVIGGDAGLDGREVRWVAVIEWPVEDFVAPGEFVLTTGIGCDDERLVRLADEVAEAG